MLKFNPVAPDIMLAFIDQYPNPVGLVTGLLTSPFGKELPAFLRRIQGASRSSLHQRSDQWQRYFRGLNRKDQSYRGPLDFIMSTCGVACKGQVLTLKGRTLISEASVGILYRLQRFTCSETEHYCMINIK